MAPEGGGTRLGKRGVLLSWLILGCFGFPWLLAPGAAIGAPAAPVNYLREVKPLLRERCYACHGALQQKGGRRLDTVSAMLDPGRHGPVVLPGNPAASPLVLRVATADLEERMPPEHEGEPFSAAQIDVLRRWIAAGAPLPNPTDDRPEPDPREHWAFQSVRRPAVPTSPGRRPADRNPIDAFVARQQAERGVTPLPDAPREVLVRRLYFDLIGLPPTPEATAAALADPGDGWYERLVDQLLADPRHGERWGRHWMDVWRYSDWWGLGDQLRNSQKHIWHWRDWIVESLNADLPYDEMIRLMLAGDELAPNDLDRLRATGFLARNWFLFNRHQWLEETVEHVGKGFLGLTLNCAKCHDHKYDPIPQADFYRMRAFFEPYQVRLDVRPGQPDLEVDGLPRAFDGPADVPTYRFVRGQEAQPDKSVVIAPGVPAFLAVAPLDIQPVSLPIESWQPERRAWVMGDELEAARRKVSAAEPEAVRTAQALAAALRQEADALVSLGSAMPATPGAPVPTPNPLPPATGGQAEGTSNPTKSVASERSPERDAVLAARRAVDGARSAWDVADAARASARAELASVEARMAAMRAAWARADAEGDPTKATSSAGSASSSSSAEAKKVGAPDAAAQKPGTSGARAASRSALTALGEAEQETAMAAVRAVRAAAVARARLALAEAARKLAEARPERKAALEKEWNAAREALAKAEQVAATAVQPEDAFPRPVGARWAATRFRSSGTDDPAVPFPPQSSGRRTALARWMTDRRHPLTARVAVNQVWMRHLGSPLVPTVFEFGRKGQPPTHPDLLDWLAAEFMEHGWSLKHLHRLIVMSSTYRRSSSLAGAVAQANLARDPDNLQLWRRLPLRLEGEVVRDALLAHAGRLDETRGGPPVPASAQADSRRRSLYFFHSNNERNLFLTTFDGAMVKECYRREQSIVPQQALALSNSRLAQEAAAAIAARLSGSGQGREQAADDEAFARRAFGQLLGLTAGQAELERSRQALRDWRAAEPSPSGTNDNDVARARLIEVLINHNDFVTVR